MQAAAGIEAAAPSRRTEILDGLKITLPFMVGAAPFGVIFGALAISQGLSVFETMALSLFVFSGSAQFVAIALMAAATPAWVIWLVTSSSICGTRCMPRPSSAMSATSRPAGG